MGYRICDKISKNEAIEILKNHQLWIKSEGKKGKRADLSGADLSRTNLKGLNLSGAIFRSIQWGGANCEREDLLIVSFKNANLSGVCLEGTDLSEVDFKGATLQGANLRNVNLDFADFGEADLTNATLEGSNITGTSFFNSKLINTNLKSINATKLGNWDEVYIETIQIDKNLYAKFPLEFIETHYSKFIMDRMSFSSLSSYSIKHNIVFPPEFHQAGISILSYFKSVLETKYPTKKVGFTIHQEGNKVSLVIEPPFGEKELIEVEFENYMEVVCGIKPIDNYSLDPLYKQAFKHKLELAALEVRHTKELLYTERTHSKQRVDELSEEVKRLRDLFQRQINFSDEQGRNHKEVIKSLLGKLENQETAVELLVSLSNLIETGINSQGDRKHAQSLLDQLNELIIKGSISGTAGNLATNLIISLSRLF